MSSPRPRSARKRSAPRSYSPSTERRASTSSRGASMSSRGASTSSRGVSTSSRGASISRKASSSRGAATTGRATTIRRTSTSSSRRASPIRGTSSSSQSVPASRRASLRPQRASTPTPDPGALDSQPDSRITEPQSVSHIQQQSEVPSAEHELSVDQPHFVTQEELQLHMDQMFNAMLQQTHHVINSDSELLNPTDSTPPNQQSALPTGMDVVQRTIPVGNHIKPSTREKILNNEFIEEFRVLLPPKPGVVPIDEMDFSLSRNPSDNSAVWVRANKKHQAPISTLEWSRAWNIFQALLSSSRPLEPNLPLLMAKHCDQVLTLAAQGYDWRSYDAGFRWEISAGSVQWGQLHLELLNDAKSRKNLPSTILDSYPRSKFQNPPTGKCFEFLSKGQCSKVSCPYNHSRKPFPLAQQYNSTFRFRVPPVHTSQNSFRPFRFPNPNPYRFIRGNGRPVQKFKRASNPYQHY